MKALMVTCLVFLAVVVVGQVLLLKKLDAVPLAPPVVAAPVSPTDVTPVPPPMSAVVAPVPTSLPVQSVTADLPPPPVPAVSPDSPPVLDAVPVQLLDPTPTEAVTPPVTMVAAPLTEVASEADFYQPLAPYGTWITVDAVQAWRPTVAVVDAEWRPYCQGGRWIYTDGGWTWYSDYSWGWAPFHYGRWLRHGQHGWMWFPGKTWGPAWVSWRSDDRHCGWAPLPPAAHYSGGAGFAYHGRNVDMNFGFGLGERDYVFVESGRFCDPAPHRYILSPARVTGLFGKTAVHNNYSQRDRLVSNGGPDLRRMEQAYGKPIPRRTLVDERRPAGNLRPLVDARQTVTPVARPVLPEQAKYATGVRKTEHDDGDRQRQTATASTRRQQEAQHKAITEAPAQLRVQEASRQAAASRREAQDNQRIAQEKQHQENQHQAQQAAAAESRRADSARRQQKQADDARHQQEQVDAARRQQKQADAARHQQEAQGKATAAAQVRIVERQAMEIRRDTVENQRRVNVVDQNRSSVDRPLTRPAAASSVTSGTVDPRIKSGR